MRARQIGRHLSLQNRMVVYFAFFLPLIILLIGLAFTFWISRTTRDSLVERYTLADKAIASEMQMLKGHDERIFISLTQNKVVQEALTGASSASSAERYEQFQSVQDFLSMGVNAGGITGVYLASESGPSFQSADNVMNLALLLPETWDSIHAQALAMSDKSYWFVRETDIMGAGRRHLYLFMARAIPARISLKGTVGVGLIRVSYTRYNSTLIYALASKEEYAVLLGADGTILMHTGDSSIPGALPEPMIAEFIDGGGAILDAREHNGIFLRTDVPDTGWTMVHYIPYAQLNQVPSQMYQFIWLVMLLSFVLMLLGLSMFARRITKPIRRLSEAMQRFGDGMYAERIHLDRGDEIGALGIHFNNMADQLTEYMSLTEENHRTRTRLELSVLENQINPHFLYNTLDLIHWKATHAGNEEISAMTTYLARFFRLGLHMGQEFIPVSDEIEHVRMYLLICKMRYGDAFTYTIDVDPAIEGLRIKKTLLQPLLENAAKYGLRRNTTDNRWLVQGRLDDAWIVLTVSDNGPGMTPERLAEVTQSMQSDELSAETGSLGLHNLYARLNFAYAGQFALTIDSAQDRGTTVTIRVPAAYSRP